MKKRLISAIIMIAVLTPIVILGNIPFQIGVTILAIFAFKEIYDLYYRENKLPIIVEVFSFLSVGLLVLCLESIVSCIGLVALLMITPILFYKNDEYTFNKASSLFGMILFIGTIFYILIYVRSSYLEEFIYLPIITILTDTFAYLGGMLFGKNKLFERVSPNKTIEGSLIGTLVATSVGSTYFLFMVNPGVNIFVVILITFLLSVIGQVGDLVFSKIKRENNIKDFSKLIPGHGGLLDRVDSLAFVSLFYVVIRLLFL